MHKLSIIPNILMEQRGGGKIIGYSRQSWQRLQNTQVVNCVRIQNSAGEKITFANLIYLSKVPILGSSCIHQVSYQPIVQPLPNGIFTGRTFRWSK